MAGALVLSVVGHLVLAATLTLGFDDHFAGNPLMPGVDRFVFHITNSAPETFRSPPANPRKESSTPIAEQIRRDHQLDEFASPKLFDSAPLLLSSLDEELEAPANVSDSGSFEFELTIDRYGHVSETRALDPEQVPAAYLDYVRERLDSALFSPAIKDGAPVKASIRIQVSFTRIE